MSRCLGLSTFVTLLTVDRLIESSILSYGLAKGIAKSIDFLKLKGFRLILFVEDNNYFY